VRVALLEKQIDHQATVVDLAAGEHRKPPFLALNPYGRVPVIDDDGFVLYESAAILSYLEATRPQRPLVPASSQGRALVDMHLRLCDGQMAKSVGSIIFPKRFLPAERWDLAAMAQARAEIEKHLAMVEQALHGREYLVGDAFTLADVAYLPLLHFLPLMEVVPPASVAAWSQRLLSRPSALATIPDQ
jgi:glutathione S-transferase